MNREAFKNVINDFFLFEEIDFYLIEDEADFDKSLMVQQFNENNLAGFQIPVDENGYPDMDSEEMDVLHEWMEENDWRTIDEEILRIVEANRINIWEYTWKELLHSYSYICLILKRQVRFLLTQQQISFISEMEIDDFIKLLFPEFYELKEEYTKDKSQKEIEDYGWFGPCNSSAGNRKRKEIVKSII